MTEQEWEDIQAELLQRNVDEFSKYLLDEGLATHAKILDLRKTQKVWRSKYGLKFSEAAGAWDNAYDMRSR